VAKHEILQTACYSTHIICDRIFKIDGKKTSANDFSVRHFKET